MHALPNTNRSNSGSVTQGNGWDTNATNGTNIKEQINMDETKQCIGPCNQIKILSEFGTRSNGIINNTCKECVKQQNKQYRQNHKEEIKERNKKYNNDHKEQNKQHREDLKENKREYDKQYRTDNIENKIEYDKQYREKHKEEIKEYNRQYRTNDFNKEQRNEREKNRREQDITYKLRVYMPNAIRDALRSNGGSKDGYSILDALPYTIPKLRSHIEAQFSALKNLTSDGKVWMTWKNWTVYDAKTWDDNDPSTWTWQLDHIKPHSLFKYATMDCQEFKDCWALANLRPLSAKQNFLDGCTKIRHHK